MARRIIGPRLPVISDSQCENAALLPSYRVPLNSLGKDSVAILVVDVSMGSVSSFSCLERFSVDSLLKPGGVASSNFSIEYLGFLLFRSFSELSSALMAWLKGTVPGGDEILMLWW